MQIRTRDGKEFDSKPLKSQKFLYKTILGRLILKALIRPSFSKKIGKKLDSPKSLKKAYKFARKNNINLDDFILDDINSFNDFFSRKIKDGRRIIDMGPSHLISPCDSKASTYKIDNDLILKIKNSCYKVKDLINNEELAKNYYNGTCLVLRLCVDDYHRYCYIDDGTKEENIFIPGVLHTVNPIALENYKIYSQNQREYTIMHTKNFGDVIQIEVGAMMVGKIVNYDGKAEIRRGEEKGKFLYGGSTIILLLNQNIKIDDDIIKNTQDGAETIVKMGEKIGELDEKAYK